MRYILRAHVLVYNFISYVYECNARVGWCLCVELQRKSDDGIC